MLKSALFLVVPLFNAYCRGRSWGRRPIIKCRKFTKCSNASPFIFNIFGLPKTLKHTRLKILVDENWKVNGGALSEGGWGPENSFVPPYEILLRGSGTNAMSQTSEVSSKGTVGSVTNIMSIHQCWWCHSANKTTHYVNITVPVQQNIVIKKRQQLTFTEACINLLTLTFQREQCLSQVLL